MNKIPVFKLQSDEKTLQITTLYNENIKLIKDFFQKDWLPNSKPVILLVQSRTDYNSILQCQTPTWQVGNSNGPTIYLIETEKIEKESDGIHKQQDFNKLLKHEMMHSYTSFYSNFVCTPSWLFEGISVCFAQQFRTEAGFNKVKILNAMTQFDGDFYGESGNFVKYLYEKYGKDRIMEMIKYSSKMKDCKSLKKIFYEIYPEEIE